MLRPASGWILLHVRDGDLSVYETALDIAEEAWLLLHQVAEVSDRGQALIRTLQPALAEEHLEGVWREFRSYVRQAEAFYRAAAPLPWKSAPLNYYYSFLNLAKGVLVLRGLLPVGKVRHGLSSVFPPPHSGISEWKLTVLDGVFPLLYEQLFKQTIPIPSVLKIDQLLAYSWPVGLQYAESGFGLPKVSQCFCANRVNATHTWTLIALPRTTTVQTHSLLGPALSAMYREIESPKDFAREAFAFHGVATAQYQFFETLNPIPLNAEGGALTTDLLAPLYQAMPGAVHPPVNNVETQFVLSLPYETGIAFMPMTELVATYAVIFFLSELTRYYPERLDHIAETRDGWLAESFVKSFPIQMLRLMLSATLGRTIILKRA
jgi:hypothetical protein